MTIENAILQPTETRAYLADQKKVYDSERASKEERRAHFMTLDTLDWKGEAAINYIKTRIDRINIDLFEDSWIPEFAEIRVLAGNELPGYVLDYSLPVGIRDVGIFGGSYEVQYDIVESLTTFRFERLMSEVVQLPRKNPDFGLYDLSNRANERVRRDMDRKIDEMGLTVMAAGLGAFASGSQYYAEPLVVNLPTSNDLDLSAQGSFNKTVIKL